MTYNLKPIFDHDLKAKASYAFLCEQAGLAVEKNLDLLLGLFDEKHELLAAGGLKANTLRGLVANEEFRGQGLMAQLVTGLVNYQASQGIFRLFLYGKKEYQKLYENLGFRTLAEARGVMVFMENSPNAFDKFLDGLVQETVDAIENNQLDQAWTISQKEGTGSIVMNANPFSLGHLSLVRYARMQKQLVHLFILEEDVSLFSFADRFAMAKAACINDPGVILHKSSDYMISQANFPSYFLKSLDEAAIIQAEIDAEIFKKIAKRLNINARFLGTEPHSDLTRAYNQVLMSQLRQEGIRVDVMERTGNEKFDVYSGTIIRELLKAGSLDDALSLVPETGHPYLVKKFNELH